MSFVDFEANTTSFSDFVSVEPYPELSEISAIGKIAYWNSKKSSRSILQRRII